MYFPQCNFLQYFRHFFHFKLINQSFLIKFWLGFACIASFSLLPHQRKSFRFQIECFSLNEREKRCEFDKTDRIKILSGDVFAFLMHGCLFWHTPQNAEAPCRSLSKQLSI